MNSVTLPGATALVTNNLSRFLSRLDRPAREAVAQAAIDQLDAIDGDADLEPEQDACEARDDIGTRLRAWGSDDGEPGDPSDTEVDDDDGHCPIFGVDQSHIVDPQRAFVDLNRMSASDIAAAAAFIPRRRLEGTLRLAIGGRS